MAGLLIYLKRLGAGVTDPPAAGPRDHHHFVVTEPVLWPVISKSFFPAASNAASGPDHLTLGVGCCGVACIVVNLSGKGRSPGPPIASLL